MPSNKTTSVLIICLAVIVSVWMFSKEPTNKGLSIKSENEENVIPAIQIEEKTNDDWKKILTSVDQKNQKTLDLTNKKAGGVEDDTTLTDQLSRDFLSQYLIASKEGIEVTPEVAFNIAQKTLSSPNYNSNPETLYIKQNLKVNKNLSLNTYKSELNEIMEPVFYGTKDDPVAIIVTAMQNDSEVNLKKLDPLILIGQNIVKGLLSMEVPESAVGFHLSLLNSANAVYYDLQAMRVSISDPVKSLTAINDYYTHFTSFQNSLSSMNSFFLKNIK